MALANLEVGGVSPFHNHSGATEIIVIAEGSSVLAVFIASSNKVDLKTLNKGDAFVFPQGLYHFFENQGKTPAFVDIGYILHCMF